MARSIFSLCFLLGAAIASPIAKWNTETVPSMAQIPQHHKNGSNSTAPHGGPLPITVHDLGKPSESDPAFQDKTLGRDGGGGGRINGHNIIIFSDTLVNGIGPLTNTIVYSDSNDPTSLRDFGEGGIPKQAVPYTKNESAYTDNGGGKTRIAIWPQTQLIPVGDNKGIGIAPVSIQSTDVVGAQSGDLYNTLFTVTADDTPSVERTVPTLFTHPGVMYGTFTLMLNPHDNKIYYFGADGHNGLKVARSTQDNYHDTSKWEFWNGKTWGSTRVDSEGSGNIIDGSFSSGDVFWSTKYNTFVIVYFTGFANSMFYYRYVKDGSASVTGEWSEEYELKDTSHLRNGGYGFNYAGHAYPNFSTNEDELLLSMTLSDGETPYFMRATLG